jgi:sulfoxide reductase heme-binding subunit YedZ
MLLLFFTLPQIYLWYSFDATLSFDNNFRISLASGYVALVLLALTLSAGVWRLLKNGKPAPVHFDLRRDMGIWGGIFALLHSFAGLLVHMKSLPYNFLYYFFYEPQREATFPVRHDIFGLANYSGLVAALLAVVLLAASNDYSMRRLGGTRWKNWQRWNYALCALTALHALLYVFIEKRPLALWMTSVAMILLTAGFQLYGYFKFRRIREKSDSTK